MKSDSHQIEAAPAPQDRIERAHLEDPRDASHVIYRYGPTLEFAGLLQRLVHRRLGLTPKWLIQRRRLQEAAVRLRDRSTTLGEVARALGYADQSHFSRDFSRVTAMTPGEFAALHVRPG